jgi:hypothetical protein
MTECLIVLGIKAIAAIAIIGLFGRQIKELFYRSTSTIGGADAGGGTSSQITSTANTTASTAEGMNSFDGNKNSSKASAPPTKPPPLNNDQPEHFISNY